MIKMTAEYKCFEQWIRSKPGWLRWKELLETIPRDDNGKEERKLDEVFPGEE